MGIHIKFAETTEEIEALFRTRHQVFVEEESAMAKRPDGRIFDRFDAYPATRNIIAIANGQVVGGARVTEHTQAGMPADDFFDFSSYLPKEASKIGSGSLLYIERAYRKRGIAFYLMCLGFRWGLSRGWSHMLAVANPEMEHFFQRCGYQPVASKRYHEKKQLSFVPMILDLKNLSRPYLHVFKKHHSNTFSLP